MAEVHQNAGTQLSCIQVGSTAQNATSRDSCRRTIVGMDPAIVRLEEPQ